MLTEGDVFVLNPGESIKLGCEYRSVNISNFNLFDYPVLWRKYQLNERTLVNIMGNIKSPYDDTDRFHVEYKDSKTHDRLEMEIHGMVEYRDYTLGSYTQFHI